MPVDHARSFPVSPGEKFAVIALDVAERVTQTLDLGDGLYALPNVPFEIPEHWQEWLGSIRVEAIRTAPLLLVAKKASNALGVLDAENDILTRRVDALYWGLLAAAPMRVGGGIRFTGARSAERYDIRRVNELRDVTSVPGMLHPPLTEPKVKRAAGMVPGLLELLASREMRRMKLAIHTFMRAFSEHELSERIHQFVRAVDGITRVWNRNEFSERSKLFVGEAGADTCRDLYVIRSNAEHFHDPDNRLEVLPRREATIRGFRRAHEAEALARYCMARLIESGAWRELADERVDAFWGKTESERAQIWGAPMDLAAAAAAFNPDHVPDEPA